MSGKIFMIVVIVPFLFLLFLLVRRNLRIRKAEEEVERDYGDWHP